MSWSENRKNAIKLKFGKRSNISLFAACLTVPFIERTTYGGGGRGGHGQPFCRAIRTCDVYTLCFYETLRLFNGKKRLSSCRGPTSDGTEKHSHFTEAVLQSAHAQVRRAQSQGHWAHLCLRWKRFRQRYVHYLTRFVWARGSMLPQVLIVLILCCHKSWLFYYCVDHKWWLFKFYAVTSPDCFDDGSAAALRIECHFLTASSGVANCWCQCD